MLVQVLDHNHNQVGISYLSPLCRDTHVDHLDTHAHFPLVRLLSILVDGYKNLACKQFKRFYYRT